MFLCRSSPAPPPHTGVIPRCRGDALAFFHMSVNCTPAKGCVWPVIAPAQAFVRAGAVLRGLAFLSRRFAIGSWLALRFCRGVLPRPMAGLAVLSRRFASVHARLCVPVAALCHRLMAGLAVLSPRFAIGSRLSFSSLRKKRRLAVCSVSVPPGRDRHSRVLQCRRGYLPWQVHFGFGRFFMAIPTG